MLKVTNRDRRCAEEIRVIVADTTGFWLKPGDDEPLVQAVARYRADFEASITAELATIASRPKAPLRHGSADEAAKVPFAPSKKARTAGRRPRA